MALTHGNLCSLRFRQSICILEHGKLQSVEGISNIKGKGGSDTHPAAKQVGFAIYLLEGSMTHEEGLASLFMACRCQGTGRRVTMVPGSGSSGVEEK